MKTVQQKLDQPVLYFAILAIFCTAYVLVAGSTVPQATVEWDEFTDLVIATQLSHSPLSGHSWDGSQARFPMYVTAVAQRILRVFDSDSTLLDLLPVSRWISILMTVLAICGTFVFGQRLFSSATGLVAAFLFAFSPFVLHFGRAALTQGDAFTPAAVIFTLIAFEQFTHKRTTFWLACFSLCLALAIAAKFFLAFLIPALLVFQIILAASKRFRTPDPHSSRVEIKKSRIDRPFTFLAVGTGLLAVLAVWTAFLRFDQPRQAGQLLYLVARLMWGGTLLGTLACLGMAARSGAYDPARKASWPTAGSWLAVLPLSLAVTLAFFPSHIFNPEVLSDLFGRLITFDGNTSFLETSFSSARLYAGLLLFKLGLPFGVLTCAALAWAILRSRSEQRFLLLTVILICYGLLLAVLPLQQPFWLMSIYPLLTITLSALIVQGLVRVRNARLRFLWMGYITVSFGWLIVGLFQVYPAFGFYGYELVGERWLGLHTRGYRSVVVVSNDGSTEAVDWLQQHAGQGSVVISFLDDPHIIDYLANNRPFIFELEHAARFQDSDEFNQGLEQADYVVARSIEDSDYYETLSDKNFIRLFGTEPVHQIVRGRGVYRMAVIEIYQRLPDDQGVN